MNKNHDALIVGEKLFRLARALGPSGARGGEITGYLGSPVIGATAGKFGGLGPIDLRIEGANGRRNVVAVECRVGFTEKSDGAILFFVRHGALLE